MIFWHFFSANCFPDSEFKFPCFLQPSQMMEIRWWCSAKRMLLQEKSYKGELFGNDTLQHNEQEVSFKHRRLVGLPLQVTVNNKTTKTLENKDWESWHSGGCHCFHCTSICTFTLHKNYLQWPWCTCAGATFSSSCVRLSWHEVRAYLKSSTLRTVFKKCHRCVNTQNVFTWKCCVNSA